jgi:Major Facilitator Superfamily
MNFAYMHGCYNNFLRLPCDEQKVSKKCHTYEKDDITMTYILRTRFNGSRRSVEIRHVISHLYFNFLNFICNSTLGVESIKVESNVHTKHNMVYQHNNNKVSIRCWKYLTLLILGSWSHSYEHMGDSVHGFACTNNVNLLRIEGILPPIRIRGIRISLQRFTGGELDTVLLDGKLQSTDKPMIPIRYHTLTAVPIVEPVAGLPVNVTKSDTNGDFTTILCLLWLVAAISALDRVAMSVALVPMSTEFGFADTMTGSISSLFSVGYGLAVVPAGLLVSCISPKQIMAYGVALWSLATIATPSCAELIPIMALPILVVRAFVGIGEAMVIPTVHRMLSVWTTSEQKSSGRFAVSVNLFNLQLANLLRLSSPYILVFSNCIHF